MVGKRRAAGRRAYCRRSGVGRIQKVVGYYMARCFSARNFMTQTVAPDLPSCFDARFDGLRDWLNGLSIGRPLRVDTLAPASADASFRRYFRLSEGSAAGAGNATLIAVDAPPPEKCREFAAVAKLLEEAGVHAPRVLAQDFERGFMLLTDLGTTAYIDVLDERNARTLMREAIDALLRWQRATRPAVLPPFDAAFLHREMELMPEWFIGKHFGTPVTDAQRQTLDATFALLADNALGQPQVFMHRDFMPRNLMVARPNPGVLDFQDAVLGPISYDVASLLRDAFISWEEAFELDCVAYYWEHAKKAGLPVDADFGEFYRQLEWMGLQRHIKILGLFARLHYRDGKPRYLADLPRFMGYARKVAARYRPLMPFAKLLDELEGSAAQVAYTF
jgi:aminoglycoside/choline kinase family phosphotransferase